MKKVILMMVFAIGCKSGNSVRSKTAELCENMQIPMSAIATDSDVLKTRTGKFLPISFYNSLADHAKDLRVCGESLTCVIEWTEYERDCEKSKSFIDRSLGFSCDLDKPRCQVVTK